VHSLKSLIIMHDLQLSCALLAVLQDSKVIYRSKISKESEKQLQHSRKSDLVWTVEKELQKSMTWNSTFICLKFRRSACTNASTRNEILLVDHKYIFPVDMITAAYHYVFLTSFGDTHLKTLPVKHWRIARVVRAESQTVIHHSLTLTPVFCCHENMCGSIT
jgi:hypothetical protein